MGTTRPSPPAMPRTMRHFPYSGPEPWSWIPGTWIQAGAVFVSGEGRFYRLVTRTDDGWKAEEVEPTEIGDPSRVAEITGLRARYEQVLTAHATLDRKMQDGQDTPENRALIRERDADLHRLRDQLILLCNGRSPEVRAATARPSWWKWTLVIVLAVGFVVAVVACIRRLFVFAPGQAGRMIAGAVFFFSGAALFVIGVRELAKYKKRLVTGNLVGCYTLFTIAVVVAAFGIMFVSVVLLYTGAYEG